jgi:hypothetical protein
VGLLVATSMARPVAGLRPIRAKEFLAGYYLVDRESGERAIDLTAQIPDAGFNARWRSGLS